MRTLLLVLFLIAVALASGGSFMVRAQEAGAATLDHRCDPSALPSGVDTLVRCSFTARNTGPTTLAKAVLTLQPGSGPLPDAYYFLSARRDAARIDVDPQQVTYDYGDLAPGATSTIELEVIVRSAHPYGASAVLQAGRDLHEYARDALGGGVVPSERERLIATLTARRDASGASLPSFDLEMTNATPQPIDELVWLVVFGSQTRLAAPGGLAGPAPVRKTVLASLPPGQTYRTTLTFEPAGGNCGYAWPAVLAGAAALQFLDPSQSAAGPSAVAVADAPAAAGGCSEGRGGGGSLAVSLPAGGTGTAAHERGHGLPGALGAAAVGALLIAAGISVRRARPRVRVRHSAARPREPR